MADKAPITIEAVAEKEVKDKDIPVKEDEVSKGDKENGDVCETKNGKVEDTNDAKSKDPEDVVCPIKRKSVGGDVIEEPRTEDVSPEKKAKLDNTSDAESTGEAEVAA